MENYETEINFIKNIPAPIFMEKMTSLCVREYNRPEHFFVMAKKAFNENYHNWTSSEQVKVIMSIFRDCYRAYQNSEKQLLGDRFLSFCEGLDLSDQVNYNIYESFFLLIRKRPEGKAFLLAAIKEERFMDTINKDFVEEYYNYDFDLYRSLFVEHIEELADYLYDSTFDYIASTMSDRYTNYDAVIYALIKRNKDKIVLSFLKNTNLLLSKDCLNSLIEYGKKEEKQEIILLSYRCFLQKNHITFKDFYSYYSLLDDEQRFMEESFINHVVINNHFEHSYAILSGDVFDVKSLRYLTIEEFTLLSDIIKEAYPFDYQQYLMLAIKKKVDSNDASFMDLFECLKCYGSDCLSLLTSPLVKEVSMKNEKYRYQYLLILKQYDVLKKANVHLYQEDKICS